MTREDSRRALNRVLGDRLRTIDALGHTRPPDIVSDLLAAMCVADGVLRWDQVTQETIDRFTRQVMGLAPNNVDAYAATWRRWARQDLRRRG